LYRTDNATSVASRPTPGGAGPNPNSFFTTGVPGVSPATIVDPDWANAVQEEIAETIEGAGITLDKTKVNQLFAAVQALAGAAGAHGQCRLDLSGGNLKLSQAGGNRLIVNGAQQQIPSGGVLMTATSSIALVAATFYYIYAALFSTSVTGAANNGSGLVRLAVSSTSELVTGNTANIAGVVGTTEANGNFVVTVIDGTHIDLQGSAFAHTYVSGGAVSGLVLEGSTTAHVTGANGVEVKSGDASRTLVGAAFMDTGPAFADSDGKRFVLSWFNRRGKRSREAFSVARTTSSTTLVELNTEIRSSFISWSNEEVAFSASGFTTNSGASTNTTAAAFDSTTSGEPESSTVTGAGPSNLYGRKTGLTENAVHFATLLGAVGGSTGSWSSNTPPVPAQQTLDIIIQG
jgi:hypothetical protein